MQIKALLAEFAQKIQSNSAQTLSPLERVETEAVGKKVKERSVNLSQISKSDTTATASIAALAGTGLLGADILLAFGLRQEEIRKRKRLATRQAS